MTRLAAWPLAAALSGVLALGVAPAAGQEVKEPAASATPSAAPAAPAATRNGREIYARFREGLADPSCGPETSERWQRHFAAAPKRLAARDDDALPLFGYVVDALRQANLPTEYALIPFVESGYKPGARSGSGPAGLWQFIALTARNHKIPMRAGYDGRLSPVESTQAAVRYLKTLHGMFAGDWRLAVMAYNAGEYRVFGALKHSGQRAMDADPEKLVGLSGITRAYVRKLHALSCVLDQADDREEWLRALDRPVAILAPRSLPSGATSLGAWARRHDLDPSRIERINPAFAGGRIAAGKHPMQVLAPIASTRPSTARPSTTLPATPGPPVTTLADASDAIVIDPPTATASRDAKVETPSTPASRTHTVQRGDSVWRLAKRYGVSRADLLERNGLSADDTLRPGMVLEIDAPAAAAPAPDALSAMPE
ncbi:transglycosylase SLT domain-containing protein [Luteimonas mephitis]|uniref:lytic transglycosylase domain-containing protein n=1 Tax=Luteimonas mephitis TaxID=83615 RepID=UPI003A922BDA